MFYNSYIGTDHIGTQCSTQIWSYHVGLCPWNTFEFLMLRNDTVHPNQCVYHEDRSVHLSVMCCNIVTLKGNQTFICSFSAYLETTVRIKEMCKKGKAIFFSLTRVGVRPNALNPITASNIWSKIALPYFTYGCQLWRMNVSNIDDIERTQKYVAKTVQSLPWEPMTK